MGRYLIGDMTNKQEINHSIIEADTYIQALEKVIKKANIYCVGGDDETDNHIREVKNGQN